MHPDLQPFVEALDAGRAQTVVMFGDSITFGSQIDPAYDHEIVFHRQWHDMLLMRHPKAVVQIVNSGVPGNKIADALARYERDVIAHSPDLVVIEFGINDCWNGPEGADAYESGLRQLIAQLQQRTNAKLILLTPNTMNFAVTPQALAMAWFAEMSCKAQALGWMDLYMDRMRAVAHELKLPIADGYASFQHMRAAGNDTDALLSNGANHPNADGHRLIAEALLNSLETH